MNRVRRLLGAVFAAALALAGGDAFAETYSFNNELYRLFDSSEEEKLIEYLRQAKNLLYGTGDDSLVFGRYNGRCFINVFFALRNQKTTPWVLSSETVGLLRDIAAGYNDPYADRHASIRIEANPDYYTGGPGTIIQSFDLTGGPIVINTGSEPLRFDAGLVIADDDLKGKFKVGWLYGLTFEGCKNESGSGGAVLLGTRYAYDSFHSVSTLAAGANSVRLINCTFKDCQANTGGGAVSVDSTIDSTSDRMPIDADRFWPFRGSELTQADYDGIKGSHIYHCTFENCTATGSGANGGAVYGIRNENNGTVITDCTFINCRCPQGGWGGAISGAKVAYRCTFEQCSSQKKGGACFDSFYIISSLFVGCWSDDDSGGAIARTKNTFVHTENCTIDNCHSRGKTDYANDVYSAGSCYVTGCLLIDSHLDPNSVPIETFSPSVAQAADLFVNYGSDYHVTTGGRPRSQ